MLGPSWAKLGTTFTAADGQYPSIYWPWILDRQVYPALSGSFDGRYVMYYSTDHDMIGSGPGPGGVAVAVADDPAGPWVNHGQVFVDAAPGMQTETPAVWWDGVKFRLFYQQADVPAGRQSTLQATSPDGLTWTKLGTNAGILGSPGPFPGDGHTGYCIPFHGPNPREMFAYHLMGGGNQPHFGMSFSRDVGATWRTDPRPLMYGWDQVAAVPGGNGMKIEWNSGHVLDWDGQQWWIGLIANFASGPNSVSRHIVQAPLSDDGRRLLGTPERVFPADPASNLRAVFLLDGHWLYYQVDDTIHVAEAVS